MWKLSLEKNSVKAKNGEKSSTVPHFLVAHVRIHTENIPNECKRTWESFISSTSLKVPIRTQIGKKYYEYKECGKTFTYSFFFK